MFDMEDMKDMCIIQEVSALVLTFYKRVHLPLRTAQNLAIK